MNEYGDDFWLAVLGKEVVERLPEQGLDGGVQLRGEYSELAFDWRREIAGDVALAFAAKAN